MRILPAALAALCLLAAASAPAAAASLDEAVLAELNFARTRPADYARALVRESREHDVSLSSFAYEDPDAFDEAIDFLRRQSPLPPLRRDGRLAAAALAHAAAQGPRGLVGHGAATSLSQRLQSRGVWAGLSAENISYGYDEARDVVRQLIVDSGVASRGHRRNIFGAGFQAAGVGCAPHRLYGAMCVIDFAGALVAR